MTHTKRALDVGLLAAIAGLTLATGYIHFWVGGILLLLNAAGYMTLAGLVVGSALLYRRALPLVLVALAAYAAVTIVGWAVMGPYFDVAYLAKAIEVALIGAIVLRLVRSRDQIRESIRWARSLAAAGLALVRRPSTRSVQHSPAAARGEE